MSGDTLWHICHKQFFPVRVKLRSEATRKQYRLALKNFSAVLGRDPTLDDLTDDSLATLVHFLLDDELSHQTINERVGRIKTLWTWIAKKGMVRIFPTLERLPVEEKVPRAWTIEELRKLFDSCAKEPGDVCGVPAANWWVALMSWLYCTSERKGATLQLQWEHVDLDGQIAVVPPSIRKGKRKAGIYQLWPECCSALRIIQAPKRKLVFPWGHNEGTFYNHFARILRRAELPVGREFKTHCLRVTHATWRDATGGDASRSLGHSDPATTRKHYIDPRISKSENPPLQWPTAS